MASTVNARRGKVETVRAKVTSKGQITLPLSVRRRLGVRAGDGVLFRMRGKEIAVEPQRLEDVFEKYRGIGTGGIGTSKEAILKWVREFRGEL
jgi:AbrB family looped-hinge helix DNA binding protein